MKHNRILALALALTMALSLVLTGCSGGNDESSAAVQSVAMLMGVDVSGSNQFGGVVEPRATVKVRKDANKQVAECYVEVGDEVHAGDKLFAYDTDALELTVTSAELEVEQIRNSITNYETQIKALEKEKKKASSSDQLSYTLQIQEAELNKSEAEYNLQKKEVELQQLKDSVEETEVLSEVDGVIKAISQDNSGGDSYGSNGSSDDAYITIMETGTYRIKGTVSEESARSLHQGMEVTAYSRLDSSLTWHGYIDTVEHLLCAQNSLLAECALVVKAGGVNDHYRAERQQLHSVCHGVGGCALYVGHNRYLLICYGVYYAGFARVSSAEKADVYPLARGCCVKAHIITSSEAEIALSVLFDFLNIFCRDFSYLFLWNVE